VALQVAKQMTPWWLKESIVSEIAFIYVCGLGDNELKEGDGNPKIAAILMVLLFLKILHFQLKKNSFFPVGSKSYTCMIPDTSNGIASITQLLLNKK